jgi:hypothetical protein
VKSVYFDFYAFKWRRRSRMNETRRFLGLKFCRMQIIFIHRRQKYMNKGPRLWTQRDSKPNHGARFPSATNGVRTCNNCNVEIHTPAS